MGSTMVDIVQERSRIRRKKPTKNFVEKRLKIFGRVRYLLYISSNKKTKTMSRTTEWVIQTMNNTETKPTVKPKTKTPPKEDPRKTPFKVPQINPDHRPKGIIQ